MQRVLEFKSVCQGLLSEDLLQAIKLAPKPNKIRVTANDVCYLYKVWRSKKTPNG
jgi:hypothetical protein